MQPMVGWNISEGRGLRKNTVIIGVAIAIVGVLMMYLVHPLVWKLSTTFFLVKTVTVLPHESTAFVVECPEGVRCQYDIIILDANDSVDFLPFKEEYFEDYQQGKSVETFGRIEDAIGGFHFVPMENDTPWVGPFYFAFRNRGERTVEIDVMVLQQKVGTTVLMIGGFYILVIGIIIGIAGLILKPKEERGVLL
jgi:hypothetical protein